MAARTYRLTLPVGWEQWLGVCAERGVAVRAEASLRERGWYSAAGPHHLDPGAAAGVTRTAGARDHPQRGPRPPAGGWAVLRDSAATARRARGAPGRAPADRGVAGGERCGDAAAGRSDVTRSRLERGR